MKKHLCFVLSLLAMLLFVGSAMAAADKSTMVFDHTDHNFGTFDEADGAVSHVFTFKNEGDAPFVIENVATTCGCTTPSYSRQPIRPGQSGEITITYDPAGRPGRFSRDIIIVSNARKNRNILTVKGVVNAREKSIEDEYPFQIEGGLRVNALMSNFSYVEQGESRSMVIGYANPTDKAMSVSVADITGSPAFSAVAYPQRLAAGERGSLTLTYDIVDTNMWGYINNSFFVSVNGVKNAIPVTTSAIIVEEFEPSSSRASRNAPKAVIEKVYYDMGNLKNSSYICNFSIANQGASPLIVQNITLPKGFSTNLKAPATIAAGASREFTFTITVAELEGNYLDAQIVLIVNEPTRPMRKISVIGYK